MPSRLPKFSAASLRAALRARFPAGEGAALLCGGREEGFACGLAELQPLLDEWARHNGAAIDYIHGADVARRLAAEGAASLFLPVIPKEELFAQVRLHGALQRPLVPMGIRNHQYPHSRTPPSLKFPPTTYLFLISLRQVS